MPFALYPTSLLRILLFPEVCLLAGIAGILAQRFPGPGLVLLALVWLLDLPRTASWTRTFFYLSVFCFAFGYAAWRTPAPEPVPDWLRVASAVVDARGKAARPSGALRIQARVLSCDLLQGERARVILTDVLPAVSGAEDTPYHGKIVWAWREPDFMPLPGQKLEISVRLSKVRSLTNPGAWDTEGYWRDRGVWFRASSGDKTKAVILEDGGLLSRLRRDLRERFYAVLPREEISEGSRIIQAAAILPAMVFADRSRISHEQGDLFAKSTLGHSLALSGLHLGFAVLAGFALAYVAGLLYPRLWLHIARPSLAMLFSLPFALLYLWLGQMPVSLVRAACMLAFWSLLVFLKRPRVLLDGLFAALAVILAVDPLALFDIGLQLSALSVAAIALCLPELFQLSTRFFPLRRYPGVSGKILRGGFITLGISFSIQVFLLPLIAHIFGFSGLLFPLNLIWLPVLGSVVLPLSFAGLFLIALGADTLASFVLYLAVLPCEALMALLLALDKAGLLLAPVMPRPHWLSAAGYWLLLSLLPGFLRRIPRREFRSGDGQGALSGYAAFVVCGLVMLMAPVGQAWFENTRPGVRLRLLDVGQGQAVLLEWTGLGGDREAGRVLIDGGGFTVGSFDVGRSVVSPVLTRNALPRLDMAIATHPDADHIAGLFFILRHFAVGHYYSNGDPPLSPLAEREQEALARRGLDKEVLCAGDRLELARDLYLEVLWPPHAEQRALLPQGAKRDRANNASLVLRLTWHGVPLLLACGDAQIAALRGLLQIQDSAGLGAQVLILPHHGSAGSLVPEFYRAVSPQLALVSCGYGNYWGFPAPAVVSALEALDIPLRSTAEFGQIAVHWTDPGAEPEISFARLEGYSDD
ncbi:MAG: DNA internalization-related competence protein ComEC/Rec2 [Desulfovibrionaceae bacterium]|nr:DNA internalization-related competence protein ComEC/Rec2 [Desulfovibrionaceae bacterium]